MSMKKREDRKVCQRSLCSFRVLDGEVGSAELISSSYVECGFEKRKARNHTTC
jgi:hypothetical protein